MPMDLLPQHSSNVSQPKSCDSRKNSRGDDDPEEIPESAHERAAGELIAQQIPRKWRRANESREKPDIGCEILYGSAAELVILGENCVLWDVFLKLNLAAFRHLACSL